MHAGLLWVSPLGSDRNRKKSRWLMTDDTDFMICFPAFLRGLFGYEKLYAANDIIWSIFLDIWWFTDDLYIVDILLLYVLLFQDANFYCRITVVYRRVIYWAHEQLRLSLIHIPITGFLDSYHQLDCSVSDMFPVVGSGLHHELCFTKNPSQDANGKWRFGLSSTKTRNVNVILVVRSQRVVSCCFLL